MKGMGRIVLVLVPGPGSEFELGPATAAWAQILVDFVLDSAAPVPVPSLVLGHLRTLP